MRSCLKKVGDGNFTYLYPLVLIFNCHEGGFLFLKRISASIIPKSESEHTVHLNKNFGKEFSMARDISNIIYDDFVRKTSKSFLSNYRPQLGRMQTDCHRLVQLKG